MRLLLLAVLLPLVYTDNSKDSILSASERKFLYKIPSRELAGRFTAPPGQKAVNLNFDVDSHESHNEIVRRSAEIRLPLMGDHTVPLEEVTKQRSLRDILAALENATVLHHEEPTLSGAKFEFSPRFERESYDFMVPEGQTEKSSEVAEVMFLAQKDQEDPEFRITMDRLNWFQIGKIVKKEKENYMEYQVSVNLQPNANVRVNQTKNAVYKFAIEGSQGISTTISRVRVDILSFGSMTYSTTTKAAAEPSTVTTTTPEATTEMEQTDFVLGANDDGVVDQIESKKNLEGQENVDNVIPLNTTETVSNSNETSTFAEIVKEEATEPVSDAEETTSDSESEGDVESEIQSSEALNSEAEIPESDEKEAEDVSIADIRNLESGSEEVVESANKSSEAVNSEAAAPNSEEKEVTEEVSSADDENLDSKSEEVVDSEIQSSEALNPEANSNEEGSEMPVHELIILSNDDKTTDGGHMDVAPETSLKLEDGVISLPEVEDETTTELPKKDSSLEVDDNKDRNAENASDSDEKHDPEEMPAEIDPAIVVAVNIGNSQEPLETEQENLEKEMGNANVNSDELEIDEVTQGTETKSEEVNAEPQGKLVEIEEEILDNNDDSSENKAHNVIAESANLRVKSQTISLEDKDLIESVVAPEITIEKTISFEEDITSQVPQILDTDKSNSLEQISPDSAEQVSESAEGSGEVEGSAEETETEVPTTTPVLTFLSNIETSMERDMRNEEMEKTTLPSRNVFDVSSSSSSEEDNPLTDAVTVATEIVQAGLLQELESEPEPMSIEVAGATNGRFTIAKQLSSGDVLRGLTITPTVKDDESKSQLVTLSTDRPDLFSIRPSEVQSGSKAYVFINDPKFPGDVNVKITATFDSSSVHQLLTVRNSPTATNGGMTSFAMSIREDSPSGTTVGKVPKGTGVRIIGKPGLFALVGDDIILSCPDERPCLDREAQEKHYVFMASQDGSFPPYQVTISIDDVNDNPPRLQTTDHVIRISDNKLIMPFGIEIMDADSTSAQKNRLIMGGSAALFLSAQKLEDGLYQLMVAGPHPPGRYVLDVTVTDGRMKDKKSINVLVQQTSSHAHFRHNNYERKIHADKIVQGNEFLRVELEGVPIDEAKFVILGGNPGWLSIEDYGGTMNFAKFRGNVHSGAYEIRVAAIDRATGRLLAETKVQITVVGGAEKAEKKVFKKRLYERTLDRETAPEVSIELTMSPDAPITIDRPSIFALDENGQSRELQEDDFQIDDHKIIVKRDSVKDVRVVQFEVTSGNDRATVVLHLSSSEEFVSHRLKMASRPVFPAPWTNENNMIEFRIPEELPIGHVVAVLPSVNPVTGKSVPAVLEGSDAFTLDPKTGSLHVAKRLNFDSVSPADRHFNVRLVAGEEGYESTADVRIHVEDVDDNPPVIDRQGLPDQIVLPENLPSGTAIARIAVKDMDDVSTRAGLSVRLTGSGSTYYHATVVNGTVSITVAPSIVLDREATPRHSFVLRVHDVAGHEDSVPLTISLSDENDNAPRFVRPIYDVQAVENWPAGVILDRLRAVDPDLGDRGSITYSLAPHNAKHFSLDALTGELSTSRDLMALAREEPYNLTAFASDAGSPPLNSSVTIRVKIREPSEKNDGKIVIVSPEVDYTLTVKEDVAVNDKVYQVKSRLVNAHHDRSHLKYTVEELNEDEKSFEIDELSGEIMVVKPLDYESKKEHLLLVTSHHVLRNTTASRILRVNVENVDDNEPEFKKTSTPLFWLQKSLPVGRLSAKDKDGDPIYYYLIPSCSPSTRDFSIDKEFGEVTLKAEKLPKNSRQTLCAIASNDDDLDVSDLEFDENRRDMTKFVVEKPREQHVLLPDLAELNNTKTIVDDDLLHLTIPISDEATTSPFHFSIINVEFIPSSVVPPRTPISSLSSLFSIDTAGNVRVSPQLSTQPQGVYKVFIEVTSPEMESQMLVKEFHLVHDENKLMYVFDMPVAHLSNRIAAFHSKLDSSMVHDHPEGDMSVLLDRPISSKKNGSRSSVCFHSVLNGSVVSEHSALAALSQLNVANSQLAQVYHNFSIVDIQPCDVSHQPLLSSSVLSLPMSSLALISLLALLTLILFILIVYCCFVRRYKNYLAAKEKTMKARSYSPRQLSAPSPTFVLAPSTIPPMTALGYWEA